MTGVYTVSQINAYISTMFSRDFALRNLKVSGEISNCKYHTAGHIYFTLKDAGAAIDCVMFASDRSGLSFRLEDGQNVEVSGRISVYTKTGSYQLYARSCELAGRGALYEQYLRLKAELEEMGMFDPIYKKPIPKYAKRIGIVTAETGAAIRDIINVASRRNPYTELFLCPALVQGDGAAASIVRGIRTLDRMGLDVLIVGRGGGSYEDLFSFNDERVVRAIFDAETPVISAVGHEVDVTLADFAADLRAPTPSAAAELAVFDVRIFDEQLSERAGALERALRYRLESKKQAAQIRRERLYRYAPEKLLGSLRSRLDADRDRSREIILRRLELARQNNINAGDRICAAAGELLVRNRHRLSLRAERLDALSPLKTIGRGFGFLEKENGSSVRSASELAAGEQLRIILADGRVDAKVLKVEKSSSFRNPRQTKAAPETERRKRSDNE